MTKPWNAPPTSGINRQRKIANIRVVVCILCGHPDPPLMHYMDGYAHKSCIDKRHKQ